MSKMVKCLKMDCRGSVECRKMAKYRQIGKEVNIDKIK